MLTVKQLWKMELEQTMKERELSDPDPDMWRWSPLEIYEFAKMAEVARSLASRGLRRLSVVEAGSGIGTKLYYLVNYLNMDAIGYEISEEYIAQANELGVHTVQLDFREASPVWSLYDIVYIARPFKDDEVEVEWERSVMAGMRMGAVLVSAYAAVKPYKWPCYYRAPFRGVWVKSPGGNYQSMISRSTTGSDPLVQEPGPRSG